MREADKQISDILERYGVPFAGNVWRVQGTAVIYHKSLERIAVQAGIAFDPVQVLRAERDEAVIVVTGRMLVAKGKPERVEWSIGEALVNVNYRVSGKQAAYVYAMAEKRAKDRVILKLIDLHGHVYSEDEADEFGESARRNRRMAAEAGNDPEPAGPPDPYEPEGDGEGGTAAGYMAECERRIAQASDRLALLTWWNGEERKTRCQDFGLSPEQVRKLKDQVNGRASALHKRSAA